MKRRSFAEQLDAFMKARQVSQADLMRALKVSGSTVSRWLDPAAARKLSAKHFLQLCWVLDAEPWELYGATFEEPERLAAGPKRGRPVVTAADVESATLREPAPSTGSAEPIRLPPVRARRS